MSDKFEVGDLAHITKTTSGENIGIVVQLIEFLGPFENLGDTWFVRSREPIKTGCTESGNVNYLSRFRHPASWMKKIIPPSLVSETEESKLVDKASNLG